MDSGGRWRLGHRPALDGLRGVAIGLVLLGHCEVPGFRSVAAVGVTLFFVLSGFLITALLLEERLGAGRVDFRRFYVRRFRRLAPAFLVSVVAVSVFGVLIDQTSFLEARAVVASLSYVGNWYVANSTATAPLGVLSGTWSLAIEEQFYLVWPVLLAAVAGRFGLRGVVRLALLGAGASLAVRVLLVVNGASAYRVYYGTDTNALSLLVGALLATLCVAGRTLGLVESRTALVVAVAALLGAGAFRLPMVWLIPAAVCAAAVAVGAVARQGTLGPTWLTVPPLVWLGRRSYAVYLWNCIFSVIAWRVGISWEMRLVVVGGLSLVVAEVSWRCVESQFLRPGCAPGHGVGSGSRGGIEGRDLRRGKRRPEVGDVVDPAIEGEVQRG